MEYSKYQHSVKVERHAVPNRLHRPRRRCGRGGRACSPGADVGGGEGHAVPAPMWAGVRPCSPGADVGGGEPMQSRRRCGRGVSPFSPGADVGGGEPIQSRRRCGRGGRGEGTHRPICVSCVLRGRAVHRGAPWVLRGTPGYSGVLRGYSGVLRGARTIRYSGGARVLHDRGGAVRVRAATGIPHLGIQCAPT